MPEPRLSVLVVARDEERNLEGCLASARFADERIVVVDAASRDLTLEIARRDAEVVAVRGFDHFAAQRNAGLERASGDWILAIDADERVTPELAAEIRAVLADPGRPEVGYRIPIRSEVLGRPFRYSGTQEDIPLRLFRRDQGRWTGLVHETVAIDGPIGRMHQVLEHRTLGDVRVFLDKIDRYTTLEARDLYRSGRRFRTSDLTLRPCWTFLKLYLYKQGFRDGVEGLMFCVLSGLSVAVRTWKLRELGLGEGRIMISTHEAEVATRFDLLHGRFKGALARDDYRLRAIVEALGTVRGLTVLDLGCGKGRFARVLEERGATVIGMDLSSAMLAGAADLDRVRATARRLPFRAQVFDAVIAVEVLEHIDTRSRRTAIDEAARVLRPGGKLVIVDKNVTSLNAIRPWLPAVAVKRIDEYRGRWMYPPGGSVRECWFWPGRLRAELYRRSFEDVRVVHLLSPAEEEGFLFRHVPAVRLMTLWVASAPGGRHV